MSTEPGSVLRAHGFRMTTQRQLVYQAVASLRHATPDAVLRTVHEQNPNINLSTIYRVLEVLERVGLITHAHLGSGPPTYHIVDEHKHLHFCCQKCGKVQSLSVEMAHDFQQAVVAALGFRADVSHVGIPGICQQCHEQEVGPRHD